MARRRRTDNTMARQYNGQKERDKQWSTKHHTETKDRGIRTPLTNRR
jgi:hypothetical protein